MHKLVYIKCINLSTLSAKTCLEFPPVENLPSDFIAFKYVAQQVLFIVKNSFEIFKKQLYTALNVGLWHNFMIPSSIFSSNLHNFQHK